jgi:hypothetical protein
MPAIGTPTIALGRGGVGVAFRSAADPEMPLAPQAQMVSA